MHVFLLTLQSTASKRLIMKIHSHNTCVERPAGIVILRLSPDLNQIDRRFEIPFNMSGRNYTLERKQKSHSLEEHT